MGSPGRSGGQRGKKRELSTTSPLSLHVFFNVCLHSRSFPLRADWRVDREPQGNWRWNSNSRDRETVASSPSFSRPAARAPRRVCSQAIFFLCQKKIPNDQKVRLSPRIKLLPWGPFLNHNRTTFHHRCYSEHKMLSPRNGCTLAGREP